MKISRLVLALASLFLLSLASFTPSASAQDEQDPSSRIARLNYVQGSVSFQPAGDQDWIEANLGRPLTTGDSIWTDQDSRSEIHTGSTAFRLGSQTGISFLNLDDQAIQVQVAQGMLSVHVRRIDPDEAYEIDSPNLAFSIVQPGDYRFDVSPNGDSTIVSVYAGQGSVTGGDRTYDVTPGQRAIFEGVDRLNYRVEPIANDAFETWSRAREMREAHLVAARYVSPEVTGYEDLDEYGGWNTDPEYGAYWVPNGVDAAWAPYHDGKWVWVAPWGWTWVDAEPWGFAPFHYGRWAIIGARWAWIPGPVAETRCVYAPALVGFVGGGGFGVTVGFGGGEGVAWFPLGPRDVYVPAYRVSPHYVEVINVTNTRVINRTTVVNVYNNYTVNHVTNVNYTYAANTRAVTAVNRQAFVSGQSVSKASIQINQQEIQHPRVVEAAALAPTKASVVGAAPVARATPPAALANRRVVTKIAPAPQAAPIGKARPASNPNLSPAAVNRAGFSQEAQTTRAAAATRAQANPQVAQPPEGNRPGNPPNEAQPGRPSNPPNEARPNQPGQPRPNEAQPAQPGQPNRPANPPDRPNQPGAEPNRPATPPNEARPNQPNDARPNQPQPNRPANPPNESRPNESRPNEAEPNRPAAPPARPNEAQPARPTNPPNRPQPNQPRPNETQPAQPGQPNRPANPPNESRPDNPRPNESQPNRPQNPPNPPQPNRPDNRPANPPQQRPDKPQPNHPAPPPQQQQRPAQPQEKPQQKPDQPQQPAKQQPKPKEKPKPKPEPEPQPQI
jgi:hypothetical protein